MVIAENNLNILHVKMYFFVDTRRSATTCQRKSPFEGFFKRKLGSAIFKASQALYRELFRLNSNIWLLILYDKPNI